MRVKVGELGANKKNKWLKCKQEQGCSATNAGTHQLCPYFAAEKIATEKDTSEGEWIEGGGDANNEIK